MKPYLYFGMFILCSQPLSAASRTLNQQPIKQNRLYQQLLRSELANSQNASPLDPLEEDRKTDITLFNYFIKIAAHFGHILVDPHNQANVTLNAAKMIDGVVAVAQELTKRNKPANERQRRNIIRLILLALQRQGYLPPKPHTIIDFGYSIS